MKPVKIESTPQYPLQVLNSNETRILNESDKTIKLTAIPVPVKLGLLSRKVEPNRFDLRRDWGYICSSCNSLFLLKKHCSSCSRANVEFSTSRGGGYSLSCESCNSNFIGPSWSCPKCRESNPASPIYEIKGSQRAKGSSTGVVKGCGIAFVVVFLILFIIPIIIGLIGNALP